MPNLERGTALHIAAVAKNYQVVQILLMNDADPRFVRGDGNMPKECCCDTHLWDLFDKYESAQARKLSNDEIIKEEDEDGFESDEDFKSPPNTQKQKDFLMKIGSVDSHNLKNESNHSDSGQMKKNLR